MSHQMGMACDCALLLQASHRMPCYDGIQLLHVNLRACSSLGNCALCQVCVENAGKPRGLLRSWLLLVAAAQAPQVRADDLRTTLTPRSPTRSG